MTITLTPDIEAIITEKIKSGTYYSANEVIRDSLRLLQEQEELHRIQTETLRREIVRGAEQADQGNLLVGDVAMQTLRMRINSPT